MSYLNFLYEKPPIHLVDGVVKDETLIRFGFQIETAFERVGDVFGNLYGDGLETHQHPRFFNSIAGSLGTIGNLSPDEPFNVEFASYTQTFVNTGQRKDFLLDLIPSTISQASIVISAASVMVWTLKASEEDLASDGDYAVSGRSLSFFSVPAGTFSVTYTGRYPSFMAHTGYLPNVYPSPSLIQKGLVDKPGLQLMPSGRYRATIYPSNKNGAEVIFGATLDLAFNPVIDTYVSPIGDTPVPSEYVNAWKNSASGYTRIDTRGVYLLDSQHIEFDTDEDIDLAADIVVFSLANVDLTTMVAEIYSVLKNHNHDSTGIVATLDHNQLTGLVPVSSDPDVVYTKSRIVNNDHPQYLHREGYHTGDSGTYNNALLGDLLLASLDPTSLYNNIVADSRRLIFGSTADGISLKYRTTQQDLRLYSQENGLSISSREGLGKQSIGLGINDHDIFSYGIDVLGSTNYFLALSSMSGRTLILNSADPSLFSDMQMRHLYTDSITLDGQLRVVDSGRISIGLVSFQEDAGNVTVTSAGTESISFSSPVLIDNMTAVAASIGQAVINNVLEVRGAGTHILFTDNSLTSSIMTTADAQIEIVSALPVRSKTGIYLDGVSGRDNATGIIDGLSFVDSSEPAVEEYSSLYVASQGGTPSTPSQSATYLEMLYPEATNLEAAYNGFYLLRTTKVDQIQDGVKYSWKTDTGDQRIDDLTEWPRAKLAAGFGDFYGIKVGTSSSYNKNGIKFGEFNNIYTTGGSGKCPAGLMVIEALAGVALVSSGASPSDCQNVTYSSLTAGDIQSRGSISVQDDISAGNDINAGDKISAEKLLIRQDASILGEARVYSDFAVDGGLNLLGDAKLNADAQINGSLDVSNGVTASRLVVNGVSEFDEIARFNGAVVFRETADFTALAVFHDRVNIDGILNANEVHTQAMSVTQLTASEKMYLNAGVDVTSDAIFHGNIVADAGVDIAGSLTTEGNVYAETLNATTDLNVAERTNLDGQLSTRDSVFMSGGAAARLTVNIPSQFTENVQLNAGLDVNGTTVITGSLNVFGEASVTLLHATNGTIDQNLDVNGNINTSNITVSNDAFVDGNISTNDLTTSGNVFFNGDTNDRFTCGLVTNFTELTTYSNGVNITGRSLLSGEISLSGHTVAANMDIENAQVSNSLDVQGNLTSYNLSNSNALSSEGLMSANGGLTTIGPVYMAGQPGEELVVTIPAQFTDEASFNGKLNVNKDAEFNGTVGITGLMTAGSIRMDNATVTANLDVDGGITSSSIATSGSAAFGGSTSIGGALSVSGITTLDGDMSLYGGMVMTGELISSGGFTALPGTFSTFEDVRVNGNFNVGGDTVMGGSLKVHSSLDVNGDAALSGALDVGGALKVNAILPWDDEDGLGAINLVAKEAYYAESP